MSVALKINRALEYFSEKELSMQLGASSDEWGITLVKELVDNALDACERDGANLDIAVTVDRDSITVTDNGPGIPADTVEKSLDYLHRVSDKALRVTPTRGQLGNALKGVYAAPFVLDGVSNVTIEAQGTRHEITVRLDRIAQQPDIRHDQQPCDRKEGTSVRIVSSQLASLPAHGRGRRFLPKRASRTRRPLRAVQSVCIHHGDGGRRGRYCSPTFRGVRQVAHRQAVVRALVFARDAA